MPYAEMNTFDALDRLAGLDTPVHRLDARAKLLATLAFILAVVSAPKYEIAALAPFLFFPVLAASLGNIPTGLLVRRTLLALPMALMLAAFNPWLDTRLVDLGHGWMLRAGWLSLGSVAAKTLLTVSAALLLVATTSFPGLCSGLTRMGVPAPFTQQLLFLWRYAGVLTDETGRLLRARDVRAVGANGKGIRVAGRLVGVLLLRTLARAERIHAGMLCRGFRGDMPERRNPAFRRADAAFLALALAAIALCRFTPMTAVLGGWLLRVHP